MSKVTVIIPVYNAAKYLGKCCKCLFSQTLEDIQFVFVNDCSSDNSVKVICDILDLYPNRKEQVLIIHMSHNEGVAAARQRGLKESSGEFVIHCDADDLPSTGMFEKMYISAIENSADIVICDYNISYANESRNNLVSFTDNYLNNPSFCISPLEGAVWNKLISKRLIDTYDIAFTHGIELGEDFLFVTKCRLLASKEIVIHEPLYNYCQDNALSITKLYSKKKIDSLVRVANLMEKFLTEHNMLCEYADRLLYLKFQVKQFYLLYPNIRDIGYWQSIFPEIGDSYKKMPIAIYVKICVWLTRNKLTFLTRFLLRLKDAYLLL